MVGCGMVGLGGQGKLRLGKVRAVWHGRHGTFRLGMAQLGKVRHGRQGV